ncbi:hypothetical protein MKX03_008634, partial [Papaver bracteatum]
MKRNFFRIFSKSKKVIKQCGSTYLQLGINIIVLNIHPVKTQIINSDDDDEDEKFKVNCKRADITNGFGFGFVGPIGHYCRINLK